MIKRVFVFDPSQHSSGFYNPDNRHTIIKNQVEGFEVKDHATFDFRTDRLATLNEWDKSDALIIAHMTDIQDIFTGLKTIKNATVICHTDKWDYSNPLLDVRITENMKNKNYHLTGSQKVKDNIGIFLNHLKSKNEIKFEIIEGFNPDES